MRTATLPHLRRLQVLDPRSETYEIVADVWEGLSRARLPELRILKLLSERFNLVETSLSPKITPSWSALLEMGVTVVDKDGTSLVDLQRRIDRGWSTRTRLPEELYLMILRLNFHFPEKPRALFNNSGSPTGDELWTAVADTTSFLATASLVCLQWNSLASALLYQHILLLQPTKLLHSLYRYPYLAVRICRFSTHSYPGFFADLICNRPRPRVFRSLLQLESLQITQEMAVSLQKPLSYTFPNLQILSIYLPSVSSSESDSYPLVLPPSLVSLSIDADWDTGLDLSEVVSAGLV